MISITSIHQNVDTFDSFLARLYLESSYSYIHIYDVQQMSSSLYQYDMVSIISIYMYL